MSPRKRIVLQTSLLFIALFGNAVTKDTIRIKVLDSETRSVTLDNSGVPRNCDPVNFDAYCHNSNVTQLTNTLLVQEGNEPPFRIACTVDTKWSKCVPLQKGRSFDSRREKRGLIVYYDDDRGKVRKQLYALVAPDGGSYPPKTTQPAAVQAGSTESDEPREVSIGAGVLGSNATVKCSFRSTPSGAEVKLDGRYVGSTPSVVSISPGVHVVLITQPGFAQWKRDLTVSQDSELTVSAILEKEK